MTGGVLEQPGEEAGRAEDARELAEHEGGDRGGGDPGESVGQAARQGDRRVGDGGRGGEPVGRGDIEPDRGGSELGARALGAEDRADQAEGRHRLGERLGRTAAQLGRNLEDRLGEHRVGGPDPEHRAGDLCCNIERGRARPGLAAQDEWPRSPRLAARP